MFARAPRAILRCIPALVLLSAATQATAQWTHRYPKVEGYSHHVYLEGYELPVLNPGPSDPAPSPDGRTIALSARGWLWLLDLSSGKAERLTRGPASDFRPRWSPDGRRLVFVRDDSQDTSLVEVEVGSGTEQVLVDEEAIDLDPIYSLDGKSLLYSSAQAGDLDLWQLDLGRGVKTRLTRKEGLELSPLPLSADALVFVTKRQNGDTVSIFDRRAGEERVLVSESIASQMRPALHPNGKSLVVPLPGPESWALWLMDLAGGPSIRVTPGKGLPIMPAFSSDGSMVYFIEADADQRFRLMSVPVAGGEATDITPMLWDWGEPTARVEIRTRRKGSQSPLPARLHVTDGAGHPVLPDRGQPRFDSQSGKVYTYSPGVLTVEAPAGEILVAAARGLSAPVASTAMRVVPGGSNAVELEISPLWNSGDDESYLEGLREGRSFVTNGPFLRFEAGGVGPGGVVEREPGGEIPWELTLVSAVPVASVEVLVNGRVAWAGKAPPAPGRQTYSGRISVPSGGWIGARAVGGPAVWPAMDSYAFAHSGAVWLNEVGSIDPEAARTAARELLAWMDVAEARLVEGYRGASIPKLKERFAEARRKLQALRGR